MSKKKELTFGPVPSRRLGRSVGINNIPPKNCTFACAYCQVGKTTNKTITRQSFYSPQELYESAKQQIEHTEGKIDYLTIVPDGEPTLDINLKETILLLKRFEIPLAIISNASLLWKQEVRETLNLLDVVSVKVDAVSDIHWKRINKPHKDLELSKLLKGVRVFSKHFPGKLISETMLINELEYGKEIKRIATYLHTLHNLATAYIAIPTRPPAETGITAPSSSTLAMVYEEFTEVLDASVEYLTGYEGDAFSFSGDLEQDLLSTTAVHPMRQSAVNELVKRANSDWSVVKRLVNENKLIVTEYNGKQYYIRRKV